MKIREVVRDVLKAQGSSKNDDDEKFDPKELEMGTKVEVEHVKDPKAAKEIAKDHIREHPNYYKRLKKAKLADELE